MNEQTDLSCSMKRCSDCHEWKPRADFPQCVYGRARLGCAQFCAPCLEIRREARASRQREWMANKRREMGCAQVPRRSSHNRIPDETVYDFAAHAFAVWPKLHLVKLAIAQAPAALVPAIKRELVAMAKAA